jgi:hypothetical protein
MAGTGSSITTIGSGARRTPSPLGWGRVQAICDYVHQHIAFGYEHARYSRTAREAFDRNRRLPELCAPRGRVVSLHDHPGAILHGHLGYIGVPATDFRSLVRSLSISSWRVVHLQRA